jgi:CRP-like cAMP-binding protein
MSFSTGNQLLERLSWNECPGFFSQFKRIRLEQGKTLYETRAPIDYAYFPTSGSLSAVVVMVDGDMTEVATIGREGAVGALNFAETPCSSNRVFVQVPGEAMRIEAAALHKRMHEDGQLRKLLFRYHDAFLFQVSQSVACNGLHTLSRRCCRWLLMTHDHIDGDEISLTQEFLAVMLGARRPTVTEILCELKERELIDYARGKIRVLNRAGLEEGACECYGAVREEYARLLD